jgi:hypothetical protein
MKWEFAVLGRGLRNKIKVPAYIILATIAPTQKGGNECWELF